MHSRILEKKTLSKTKRKMHLECFGTANMSDACGQCTDNSPCVEETMKRFNESKMSLRERLRKKTGANYLIAVTVDDAIDAVREWLKQKLLEIKNPLDPRRYSLRLIDELLKELGGEK